MILLNKTKVSVDGIDVYPDDDETNKNQFWYIPGKVQLAQRDGKPVLSYMWYKFDVGDSAGTGFLNFEVNTAVDARQLQAIEAKLRAEYGIKSDEPIRLTEVAYDKGKVAFSVLGPTEDALNAVKEGHGAVVYRSKEKIVWQAGSPSLVGDNTAVCSVKFTKDGQLAAAMYQAIAKKLNTVAAVYVLEFLAMRPAVRFKVTGDFDQFLLDYKASITVPVPLEAILLDIGIETEAQVGYSKRKLHVELIDYTGDPKETKKSLKWAKKIFVEYLLKNFFESSLPPTEESERGLEMAPGASSAPTRSEDKEDADDDDEELEDELVDDDGDDDDDVDDDADEKDVNKFKKKRDERKAEQNALSSVPTVTFRLKTKISYEKKQLDFMYSHMKAIKRRAGARGLVLEGLIDPEKNHIFAIDRNLITYAQPYPVEVVGPEPDHFRKYQLSSVTLGAHYPADAPENERYYPDPLRFTGEERTAVRGTLNFSRDQPGNRKVAFNADLNFKDDLISGWVSDAREYKVEGTTEGAVINLSPGEYIYIKEITVLLQTGFVWKGVDQVIVTINSDVPDKSKPLQFTEAEKSPQKAQFRFSKKLAGTRTFTYSVELRENGVTVGKIRTGPIDGDRLTVRDAFASHVPVILRNELDASLKKVYVDLSYTDEANDDYWSDNTIVLVPGGAGWSGSVPTKKEYKIPMNLPLSITVTPGGGSGGDPIPMAGHGGPNLITGKKR